MNTGTDAHKERLARCLKSAFPYAHIRLASADGEICEASNAAGRFHAAASMGAYKSISVVNDDDGAPFYCIFFPVPPALGVNIFIPAACPCDILTVAKMAESIIKLSGADREDEAFYARQRSVNMLLERVLNIDDDEGDVYTSILAADLGFDMSVRRTMFVVRLIGKDEENEKAEKSFLAAVKKIRDAVSPSGGQDIIGFLNRGEVIICRAFGGGESTEDFIKILRGALCGTRYAISAGPPCESIDDYAGCFRFVLASMQYAEEYGCMDGGSEERIFYATDFLAEYIASRVPESMMAHFYANELEFARSSAWFVETLKALADCDMEINAAAKALFIHRNTMVFRVNQIRKKLGLDPINNDSDRFRLILFCRWRAAALREKQ